MTARHFIPAVFAAAMLLLSSCGGGNGKDTGEMVRKFPEVKVPAMYSSEDEIGKYVLEHFWDRFFADTGRYLCDSVHIAGVQFDSFVTEIASYIRILENCPLEASTASISHFFSQLEAYQKRDTTSNAYERIVEGVSYYLYDPNSPVRDEDLYLPFVSAVASSELTKEDMRAAYAYDARMCALNRRGEVAPDFSFVDDSGRMRHLHGLKGDYTILLFINPGCHACGEIVESFDTPQLKELQDAGKVTVVSMYIDEEIDKWKEKRADMPSFWINGYDPTLAIRNDNIYNVRAIPSVYLLDGAKKIMLKDAPPERVLEVLASVLK